MSSIKGIGYGGATLLVLFAILCLTLLSVLSFHSARTEYIFSKRYSESVSEYYKADSKATQVMARLRKAKDLYAEVELLGTDGVEVAVTEDDWNIYTFSYKCNINKKLDLNVSLKKEAKVWSVLAWNVEELQQWTPEDSLPLWQGAQ